MKTHSSTEKEQERLKALKDYEILDSYPEAKFDRITELASIICKVPISLITLIDKERQWFKSKVGLEVEEATRARSFCQLAIMDDSYFEVPDVRVDPRFEAHALITADPNIRFYGGYPLIDPNGYALGTLCVLDRAANTLDETQQRTLKILAEETVSLIVEHRKHKELNNFEKLFGISNDLICVVDTDGFFKKVNPAFAKLLGWDEGDLKKNSLCDLIHPDDLKISKMEISKLSKGENTIVLEHRFKTKYDGYKILQWAATQEPNTLNVFGIARDITEERTTEKELIAKEARLRIFFENSQGLMCTHDLDGNFLSVNSAGAAMLGYSAKEILGFSLYDITPLPKHPLVTGYLEQMRKEGAAEGQMFTTHKDGSPRIWMFKNVLEVTPGANSYVIGNAIDITERHRLEKDLEHTKQFLDDVLHAASEVSIIATDERGLITVYNTGAEKLLGYTAEEMIGQEFTKVRIFAKNSKILGSEQSESDYVRKDGQTRRASVSVTPIKNKANKISGYLNIALDITSLYMQREELTIEKARAEEANVAKSEFLANMSHEIRTPLNGVIGFTDLVLKTKLTETQQQYLTIVNQSANALLSTISDILDFSKIEAGKLELMVERCDLFEMSSQATDIITYQVQMKGLEILLNIPSDLPRFIWADPVRLKQILINLLSNASKFTETGEIELKIEVIDVANDLTHFRFSVRDTGIGIAMNKQQKIFEAFAQEDGTTTKKYGGTGLGLTISNKLLGLMDSKLELVSTPDKGTTFYFDLKLEAEQGDSRLYQVDASIDEAAKVADPVGREEKLSILIAEDNAINMLLAKTIVKRIAPNATIHEAANGLEALEFCRYNRPDLILMDIQMPEMNGYEATKNIRQLFPKINTPIIALTAGNVKREKEKCLEAGMNDFLLKPIVEGTLVLAFEKWLQVPRT